MRVLRPARASPSPGSRMRLRPTVEARECLQVRESTIPDAGAPVAAVCPQAVAASQHAFTATPEGNVVCLGGNHVVECVHPGEQVVYSSPRQRPFRCVAISPCGNYLAAGEGAGRTPQVLVFDRSLRKPGPIAQLNGHYHGIRLVAWSATGKFLVSAGEGDSDHGDAMLFAWSWPQGEKSAALHLPRGLVDVSFVPRTDEFVTLMQTGIKKCQICAQEGTPRRATHTIVVSAIPLDFARKNASRQTEDKDCFVAVACGTGGALFVLRRHGVLCRTVVKQASLPGATARQESPPVPAVAELGRKAHAMVWLRGASYHPDELLVCGLAGGYVHIVDANNLVPVDILSTWECSPLPVMGVSCSKKNGFIWVLYQNCSLRRWQAENGESRSDWKIPSPITKVRDIQVLPKGRPEKIKHQSNDPVQVIATMDRGIKILQPDVQNLNIEATDVDHVDKIELSAVACSALVVACGHRNGEICLVVLNPCEIARRCKHQSSEVQSMAFAPWFVGSEAPLFLASASKDRSVVIWRIDVDAKASNRGKVRDVVPFAVAMPQPASPVQGMALLRHGEELHLAAYGPDRERLLYLRELVIGPSCATVTRTRKIPPKSTRWAAVCAHPARPSFFAVGADRRVLHLEMCGRPKSEVRIDTGSRLQNEFVGPVRTSGDGRMLMVNMAKSDASYFSLSGTPSPTPAGVLVLETCPTLQPLLKIAPRADEVPGSLIFYENDENTGILGCWPDGAMLVWQIPKGRRHAAPSTVSRSASPPNESRRHAVPSKSPRSTTPPNQVKRADSARSDSARGRSPKAQEAVTTMSDRESSRSRRLRLSIRRLSTSRRRSVEAAVLSTTMASIHTPNSKRKAEGHGHPDADGLLERIAASSPNAPRWAGGSNEFEEEEIPPVRRGHLLGKWARGSKVGAQVRSASDLLEAFAATECVNAPCRSCSSEALCDRRLSPNSVTRAASDGPPMRGCSPQQKRDAPPLPPRPRFPPPGEAGLLRVQDLQQLTPTMASSLPTPCRRGRSREASHDWATPLSNTCTEAAACNGVEDTPDARCDPTEGSHLPRSQVLLDGLLQRLSQEDRACLRVGLRELCTAFKDGVSEEEYSILMSKLGCGQGQCSPREIG